jgi:GntR family transcriptional regulator/MocR family aminotransferase
MSGERRREVLAWAREGDRLVIEDDYDAEFRFDREPVRAVQGLDPERVAYIGTISKTLAPAFRLGWLVAPGSLIEEAGSMKQLMDAHSPRVDQLALAELIARGDWDRHIRRVRGVYRARRDQLTESLARRLPGLEVSGVTAGLHVTVRFPPGIDDIAVAAEGASGSGDPSRALPSTPRRRAGSRSAGTTPAGSQSRGTCRCWSPWFV